MREVDILPSAPDGMPVLSRGRHISAEEGACLMEYVSVLAGEPFSDNPRCVDPLLVRLSWAVNDCSVEPVRARLAEFAPRLIGTRTNNPASAPTILLACMDCVASNCDLPMDPFRSRRARAERRLRKAQRRPSGWRARWADVRYREFQADEIIRDCARIMADKAPESLPLLLEAGMASLGALSGSSDEMCDPRDGQSSQIQNL
jgi:hypothetical protein